MIVKENVYENNLPKIYQRELIEKKEPTSSSKTWYNLYSDGYCEQGGSILLSGTDTISLVKSYSNAFYHISISVANKENYPSFWYISTENKTTSDFQVVKSSGGETSIYWSATGYTSSKGLTYKIIKY